jgi:hypothetical protein
MRNHGIYTDTAWTVPVTFVDPQGVVVDMSGADYIAEVVKDGVTVFVFRSVNASTSEGTIDMTDASTGVMVFNATETQHAAVASGMYRLHLVRDLTDDIWAAEATLVVGGPGDRETYLRFDTTVGATVELPIVVGGSGNFSFDGGSSNTNYTGFPVFDLGGASGTAGGSLNMGSAT